MTSSLNDFVAAEVRAELARRNRSREELAKALDVSRATLNRRLAGDQAFTLAELEQVAEFFGCPVDAFMPAAAPAAHSKPRAS